MNTTELKDLFRSEVNDIEPDYLWTDADAFAYMDDAQTMFCRLTDGIADASSSVTRVDVPLNADWVKINPAIKLIRSAHLASTGQQIEVLNHEDLDTRALRFDGRTGPVKYLVTGLEENKARVYPKASLADVIQLVVFRLPVDTITAGTSADFEIPDQHVFHLMKWMKYLAYSKQDAETLNPQKAAEFKQAFEAYCALALHEQRAKRHKVRVVTYGGI